MNFTAMGDMDLVYVGPSLTYVDYGAGGQYFAHMEGTWHSDRLNGQLRLTNLAPKRPDDVNLPTLRGVLETDDGVTIFVEMNGIALPREGGRLFVTSLTLRTGSPEYQWVNTLFAVVEGFLHGEPRPYEFRADCQVYVCEPTITPKAKAR